MCAADRGFVIKTIKLFEITDGARVYIADGCLPELIALQRLRQTHARHVITNFTYKFTPSALRLRMKKLKPLKLGKLGIETARRYTRQLFEAVNDMHSSGVIHGDIKLSNLMVDKSRHNLFVIDYGLSKVDFGSMALDHTLYTAGYKPPEILLKEPDFDPRKADIWAAGVCAASFVLNIDCGCLLSVNDDGATAMPKWMAKVHRAMSFIGQLAAVSSLPCNSGRAKLYKMMMATMLHPPPLVGVPTINDIKIGDDAKLFISSAMSASASKRPTAAELLSNYSFVGGGGGSSGGNDDSEHYYSSLAFCSSPLRLAEVSPSTVNAVCEVSRMLSIKSRHSVTFKTLSVIDALSPTNLFAFKPRLLAAAAFALSVSLCESTLISINRIATAWNIDDDDVDKLKSAIQAILKEKSAISALASPSAFDAAVDLLEIDERITSTKPYLAGLAADLISAHSLCGKLTPLGIVTIVPNCIEKIGK